jgi:hypothetical protein
MFACFCSGVRLLRSRPVIHRSQSHAECHFPLILPSFRTSLSRMPLQGPLQHSQTYLPAKLHPSISSAKGMKAADTLVVAIWRSGPPFHVLRTLVSLTISFRLEKARADHTRKRESALVGTELEYRAQTFWFNVLLVAGRSKCNRTARTMRGCRLETV